MDVTETTFETDVVERSREQPVVVDFWAEWCGPCHAVAPVLDKIVQERNGDLKLVKINIDEQPALAQRYGVQSIPTIILFKGGEPVERLAGYRTRTQIAAALAPHLEAPAPGTTGPTS